MKIAAAAAMAALLSCNLTAAGNDVVYGNLASTVRVIIYDDLQCSDCGNLQALLDEKLLPRYGARVAFVRRDFPLGKHDWARAAAIAARWVYEHNSALGAAIRRELLSEQGGITTVNLRPWLAEFARRNKLDAKGIVDSIADPRLVALVDQDIQSGKARGVTRTPTIFLGGQSFIEIIIYDDLARALDESLK